MNIIVGLKQVPDPEAPVTQFSVDSKAGKVIASSAVTSVVSPFDENAVEAGPHELP